jgi:glutamine cyclotransferase
MKFNFSKLRKLFLLSMIISTIYAFRNSNTENSKFFTNKNEIIGTKGYRVLKISEQRNTVYTQGLILTNDGKHLYESGGLYDKSTIKKYSFPALNLESQHNLNGKYFAEGIAKCGNKIYQLTWQERDILIYDSNLHPLETIKMDLNMREGWGLTEYSDDILLGTDGSDHIFFLKCNENLKMEKKIHVNLDGISIDRLNALVYSNGYIYANRYYDTKIYKINPGTGNVIRTYEMSPLIKYELKKGILTKHGFDSGNVLNGIAYDKTNDNFILTGKLWGYFYVIKLDD